MLGGQTDSQVSSQVHVSEKKNMSKLRGLAYSSAASDEWTSVNLRSTWVGWPNDDKLASPSVQM